MAEPVEKAHANDALTAALLAHAAAAPAAAVTPAETPAGDAVAVPADAPINPPAEAHADAPTAAPTAPTDAPTDAPTTAPIAAPADIPNDAPAASSITAPTAAPTAIPTTTSTTTPAAAPVAAPAPPISPSTAAAGPTKHQQFFNYPPPHETILPWKEPPKAGNPIIGGSLLVASAAAVERFGFIRSLLYKNTGFGSLSKLKELLDIDCRYDPAVIPLRTPEDSDDVVATYTRLEGLRASPPRSGKEGRSFWSVRDYHEAYTSGRLTPTDVVNKLLPLIRRDLEKSVRSVHSVAWLQSRVDLIEAAAAASTRRYKEGKQLGVLDGVPVGIKDEVDIKGYKKCLGSAKDYTMKEDETSWCVGKWEEVGAIVVGKTNMHEIGMDTTNLNPVHGTPLNPYNSGYFVGGSSGGSGYSLAAGLVPIALGVDGGGSIRIPSAFCGVYGLKPSHGRISARPTPDIANTVSCEGPMAVDMSSLEVAYRVMATPDPDHRHSGLFPPPRLLKDPTLRPKLLGIPRNWYNRSDPNVKQICDNTIAYMIQSLGYQTIDVQIPLLYEGQLAHAITILNEAYAGGEAKGSSGKPDTTGISPANKILFALGSRASAIDFLKAQQLRQVLMKHLAHLYSKHPGLIIVTPTTPCAGWAIKDQAHLKRGVTDGDMSMRSMEYVWLANFAGCPAISFPAGYAEPKIGKGTKPRPGDGRVPVGFMGMGEWGSEEALIEFGYDGEKWLHESYAGGRLRPGNWVDVLGVDAKSDGAVKEKLADL